MFLSRTILRASHSRRGPALSHFASVRQTVRIQRVLLPCATYATNSAQEDDRMAGDYPDYPYVSNQSRDPYEKYDDQQLRRNYNDPLHEDDDMLNMWSPDIHDFVSDGQAFKSILYFFATVGVGSYICTYFMPEKPAAPRVYPNGLFKELGGSEDFEEVYAANVDDGTYYIK
ncbi:putative NIAM subunit of mitochondrial NADH:ubiquinone oxidoreductase [Lipomyces starkeyi]